MRQWLRLIREFQALCIITSVLAAMSCWAVMLAWWGSAITGNSVWFLIAVNALIWLTAMFCSIADCIEKKIRIRSENKDD